MTDAQCKCMGERICDACHTVEDCGGCRAHGGPRRRKGRNDSLAGTSVDYEGAVMSGDPAERARAERDYEIRSAGYAEGRRDTLATLQDPTSMPDPTGEVMRSIRAYQDAQPATACDPRYYPIPDPLSAHALRALRDRIAERFHADGLCAPSRPYVCMELAIAALPLIAAWAHGEEES